MTTQVVRSFFLIALLLNGCLKTTSSNENEKPSTYGVAPDWKNESYNDSKNGWLIEKIKEFPDNVVYLRDHLDNTCTKIRYFSGSHTDATVAVLVPWERCSEEKLKPYVVDIGTPPSLRHLAVPRRATSNNIGLSCLT